MVLPQLKNLFFPAFFLFSFSLLGQSPEHFVKEIEKWRNKTVKAEDRASQKRYNDSCLSVVREFLNTPESFDQTIGSDFLGDLRSPDDAFRMIVWNVPRENQTYNYYTFLQLKDEQRPYFLTATSGSGERPETKTLNHEDWYGALYYEIIPFEYKKEKHYTLLGWDGNDRFTTRKVMDILYFNKHGEPKFGKPLFKGGESMKNRVILEYKKDASVSLKYHEDDDRIIFNRLEPLNPNMEGVYQFYTPTLQFDSYQLTKNGEWMFEEDVEIIMETQDIFNDPRNIKEPVSKPGNRKE